MTHEALIARLEKLTRPSSEVDAGIYETLFGRAPVKLAYDGNRPYPANDVPPYTASLDSALTLVPEGWTWNIHHGFSIDAELMFSRKGPLTAPDIEIVVHDAVSPAIALCIAALKAREASKP